MIDIGLVGLDTSHAEAFASMLADFDDMRLHSVWDDEAVRETPYVEDFCKRHGTRRYDRLSRMVDKVDAAMVLTVNWDTHHLIATQFLAAGVPTLVDKPLSGRCEDLDTIADATDHAPLFGGALPPRFR